MYTILGPCFVSWILKIDDDIEKITESQNGFRTMLCKNVVFLYRNDTMFSGYEAYPTSTEFRTLSRTLPLTGIEEVDHPRVVFISSRVPAADVRVRESYPLNQ